MTGLTLDVLRGPYASKKLLSSTVASITVVNVDGPFEPSPASPAYRLESHVRGCVRLVPVLDAIDSRSNLIGPMFGGNYAATSDGRLGEAIKNLLGVPFYGAVAIHDHFETKEQYASNSR